MYDYSEDKCLKLLKLKVKVRFKVIQGEGKAGGYLLKLAM